MKADAGMIARSLQRAVLSSIGDRLLALRGRAGELASTPAFTWLARLVSATVLVACSGVLIDALARRSFAHIDVGAHLRALLGLYAAAGAFAGLVGWIVVWTIVTLTRGFLARRRTLGLYVVRAVLAAAIAVFALKNTSFWLFSGRAAQRGAIGVWGPYLLLGGVALATLLAALVVQRALAFVRAGKSASPLAWSALLLATGVALVIGDLQVLVALYARLHSAVELIAAALFVCSFALLSSLAARASSRFSRIEGGFAALALVWAIFFAFSSTQKSVTEERLRHTRSDPVYAGRMLRRMEALELWLSKKGAPGDGPSATQLDAMLARYDVESTTREPMWDTPLREAPDFEKRIQALRGPANDYNIIVYYVDTLRQDVAYDEEVMPHMAAFARSNLKFEQAYSAGSDTLRALPALLGGNYDIQRPSPNGVLEVARRNGMPPTLFIAESAYEFLSKLMPGFAFDDVVRFSDYAQGGVWGYGADSPTAGPLVSKALEWMSEQGQKRFFAFLFNFDVHNWRELKKEHVYGAAAALKVPDEGRWNWRYRVVARSVDEQFGRLLQGLDDLGLTDRTIVLFVSDHGEALGYHGFWVHSIFLWESLVRVPLAMRIPGIGAESIKEKVSLVDVAPTLARNIEPNPPTVGYHGRDLLGMLVPDAPKRHLPILLSSAAKDQPNRIGLVDGDWKLVLPLEWCEPQLYDLRAQDPDDLDVAAEHPRETAEMMNKLMRSPVFSAAQQDLRSRQAQ